MKLVIATFAAFLAFLLPAKADWICDAQTCYPAPPGYTAYVPSEIPPIYVPPDYVDTPAPYRGYTTRTGRTIHRRPVHTFKVQGTLVARRNCAVIKERGRSFSLLCR